MVVSASAGDLWVGSAGPGQVIPETLKQWCRGGFRLGARSVEPVGESLRGLLLGSISSVRVLDGVVFGRINHRLYKYLLTVLHIEYK